ncbi:carboxylesterase/lipase family protein [Gilvimarinus sp. F26214L]|uniref:carboxylesterase/lipase family protein n=1 Tax=Gilvimarinus sp. DZF01 TaxID=3461371 RepID=UPI004045A5E8
MSTKPIQTAISRRKLLQGSALGGLALTLPVSVSAQTRGPVVETSAGKLRGAEAGAVKVFKGIQYGEPPRGARRFKPAGPAQSWTGVRDALAYGHCSPQGQSMEPERTPPNGFSLQGPNATFSEDCLYLNVWTPGFEGKRPVMVWLHGGGFSSGSGGSILYDGTNLAGTQDVVVVTLNHRLNAFGYLDLAELGGEEYANSSAAGMLDIVLALQWVRENIERFGGDPNLVTIFGESGGGRKVSNLMAMPPAQGLFHRAIVQSGSQLRSDTQEVGTHRARLFLEALGLGDGDLGKLKDIPPEKLLGAMRRASAVMGQFRPTVGSPALPTHPFDPKAPAVSASVPMMIGTNETEVSFFMSRDPRVMKLDDEGVIARIADLVPPDQAANVYGVYRKLHPELQPAEILFRVGTDRGYFLDSTIQSARKAEQGKAPAFLYSFEWEQPLGNGRTHVPHGSEIAFAFNNVHLARGDNPEPLAAKMSQAWATFARTGDPSTEAIGRWTPYNADTRPTMVLDRTCRMENDPRGTERELMLSFGSQQYAEQEIAPLGAEMLNGQ